MIDDSDHDTVVAKLYATIGDTGAWADALLALRSHFDCAVVDLNMLHRTTYRSLSTAPALSAAWAQRWASTSQNPINAKALPVGGVALGRDLVDPTVLANTPYYNDFLLPADIPQIMIVKASDGANGSSVINILRGLHQPEFSASQIAVAERLSRHIVNTLRTAEMLGWKSWVELTRSIETERVAMIFVDAAGAVLYMNWAAKALADARDGIVVSRGDLGAVSGIDATRLRKAIWHAATAPTSRTSAVLSITRASGSRPLLASITPLADETISVGGPQPRALVAILDPMQSAVNRNDTLQQLFGVTRREADIAHALAEGLTIAEAADRCGVTLTTARNYLARVLRKTHSSRQGELVLLLNGLTRLSDAGRRP